ncbi:aspartate kinase [Canibacter sp. lx-45]|uniref:aspartate kinase n=1 Tax=Canibacter zhuwentaonis TaxID=2837491 RepID=UPI001BDC346B|nr:aspartate kinase [Canibacter zhuwentaonis]MBT1035731.1 aspartate kinase [Canibacter zhuwentaonis]
MALIVQKYGGSSVADAASIKRIAKRIVAARKAGNNVAVVVSAMGDTTDELLDLADQITPIQEPRELDMLLTAGERISMALLAMAIKSMGADAISFTGSQAGMLTDATHGAAKIVAIEPWRVKAALDAGAIAIVAGFQGFATGTGNITTLGRGGSDTTAVALATALNANWCEIYTDVDGIFTADPRVVPLARKLDAITCEEMLELAASGAKVLHLRAVEFARRHGVKLHVRSSFSNTPGTLVYDPNREIPEEIADMEQPIISGIAAEMNDAKITVVGVPDAPGRAAQIFGIVATTKAHVDMIVQNVSAAGSRRTDISFTVPISEGKKVVAALQAAEVSIGFESLQYDDQIAKIAVVGAGMRTSTELSALLFNTLYEAGINIEMISTSEIRISVVTRADVAARAQQVLHTALELDAAEAATVYAGSGR